MPLIETEGPDVRRASLDLISSKRNGFWRNGSLADAVRYALTRWSALCCFLNDGRIELDTNTVERAIRTKKSCAPTCVRASHTPTFRQ